MLDDLKPSTRLRLYATISGLLSYVHGFAAAALEKCDLGGFAFASAVFGVVFGFAALLMVGPMQISCGDDEWKRERDREER